MVKTMTMKTYILKYGMVLLAAAGCTAENIEESHVGTPEGQTYMTLIGNTAVDTKLAIGDKDGDRYPLSWSAGDQLGLYSVTEGAQINNIAATLAEGEGTSTGRFTVSDPIVLAESGETEICIYYPYDMMANFSAETAEPVLEGNMETSQEQSAANVSDEVMEYGLAYATAVSSDAEEPVSFTLNHAMAYIRVNVSSTEYAGYTLKSVTFSDKDNGTPLSGRYSINLKTGTVTPAEDLVSSSVQVRLAEDVTLSSASQSFYMAALPADLTGKDVYVVVAMEQADENGGVTSVTIPVKVAGKNLEAGKVNVIDIEGLSASDNSCPWYEPVETRLLVDGYAYGEANCIMSTFESDEVFSVKARGDFSQVQEPKYAKVIWGLDQNASKDFVTCNGSPTEYYQITGPDYNITANVIKENSTNGGIGQIAIYGDDQTKVLWSFMIWHSPQWNEHQYKNGIVLDRNIGALNQMNRWTANGIYIQWGRYTFMPWSTSNRQNATSVKKADGSIRTSNENPLQRIYTEGVENCYGDWYWSGTAETDRKDDLWGNPDPDSPDGGQKSIYDPCPKGWRVVTPAILKEVQENAAIESVVVTSGGNAFDYYRYVYEYEPGKKAYWPCAGEWFGSLNKSNSGNARTLTPYDVAGFYWANSPASTGSAKAYCLYLKANGQDENNANVQAGSTLNTEQMEAQAGDRANACSVRCMKDTGNR